MGTSAQTPHFLPIANGQCWRCYKSSAPLGQVSGDSAIESPKAYGIKNSCCTTGIHIQARKGAEAQKGAEVKNTPGLHTVAEMLNPTRLAHGANP